MDNFGTVNSVPKRWWGKDEPTDKKMIWYRNGTPYVYENNEWVPMSGGSSNSDCDGTLYNNSLIFAMLASSELNNTSDDFINLKYSDLKELSYEYADIPSGFKFAPRTGFNCCNMFAYNTTITDIPSFDTSNVTAVTNMFLNCINLKSIGLLDFSNVGNIDMGGNGYYNTLNFLASNLSDDDNHIIPMALTDVGGFKDLGKACVDTDYYCELDLGSCPNLTHESLMNIINTVYDFGFTATGTDNAGGIICLGKDSTLMNKLSADDITIAKNKGWWIFVD